MEIQTSHHFLELMNVYDFLSTVFLGLVPKLSVEATVVDACHEIKDEYRSLRGRNINNAEKCRRLTLT